MPSTIEVLRFARLARAQGKKCILVSPLEFRSWKEAGCTHVCFSCGLSPIGYSEEYDIVVGTLDRYALRLQNHNDSHPIIGNVQNYQTVGAWLAAEVPDDFPFLIAASES